MSAAPDPSRAAERRNGGTESRRDELLRIAARVFAAKGIASATVRDIAQEAGILSGSLYHHFTSKEEMVREILFPRQAVIGQTPEELIAECGNAAEGLRTSVVNAVTWVARNPDVARILRNDAQYIKETPSLAAAETGRQRGRVVWVALVEAGIADGSFRGDVDADLVVRAMWDGVLSSIRWFPPLGDSDPAYIGGQLADFFLRGLGATTGRRSGASKPAAARSTGARRKVAHSA